MQMCGRVCKKIEAMRLGEAAGRQSTILEAAGSAIRFLNRGHHNNGFDTGKDLGVACPSPSHIGSSNISFFNVENKGTVHPGAECAFYWDVVTFERRMVCRNQLYSARSGVIGAGELL